MESRKVGVGLKKGLVEKKQFKTIVLVNLEEELLSRPLLESHFSKYGQIVKMHVSLRNKNAVISFSKASEAKAAKEQGSLILPHKPPVKMFYTEKGLEGGRSRPLMRTISAIKAPSSPSSGSSSTPPTPIQAPSASSSSSSSALKPAPIKVVQSAKAIPSLASVVAQQQQHPHHQPQPNPHAPHGDRDPHCFYPDTPEAQELYSKRAVTAEERYRLLEARDKMIRARNPKVKMRVEFAVKLSGTCPDMCPEKERYMREVQRQLTPFEIVASSGRDMEVDHRLAVKAYARSSADQEEPLSHELRPSSTLEMSLSYILHSIIPRVDQLEDLANWYNFVWDRTRSIRKEITQQQLCDLRAVAMMEKCARFHIYCSSRLCELDRHAFEMKLNDENLMKCLQSLEHMYTDLNLMGISCPNEPEFRAYQILMNLNEGDFLWEIQQKPDCVRISSHVQFAVKIHMAMFEKNYSQFFKLVRSAPYLTACILHRYFFQVRSTALRTIFKAYSIHNKSENYTSLSAVQRVLGFAQNQPVVFQYFCSSHGVNCDFDKDRITLSKKTFDMPDGPSITREYYLIESKLDQPINVILNGGPLGKNPYPDHCPHTSFNEQGYLIPGELIGVPMKGKDSKVSVVQPQPQQQQQQQQQPPPPPPVPVSTASAANFSWTLPTTSPGVGSVGVGGGITTGAAVAPGSSAPIFPAASSAAGGRFPFKPFGAPGTLIGTGAGTGTGTGPGGLGSDVFAKPSPVFPPPTGTGTRTGLGGVAPPPPLPTPHGSSTSSSSASPSGSVTSIFGGSFQGTQGSSNAAFDRNRSQTKLFIPTIVDVPELNPFDPSVPNNIRKNLEHQKRLKEDRVVRASESVYNKMVAQESEHIAHGCQRQAQMERHKKVQRQLLLEKTSHRIYSRLEQRVIENVLEMLLARRRQVQVIVNRKCETLRDKLVEGVVSRTILHLSKACFSQAKAERDANLRRLDELMGRIRLRAWLGKWRRYVEGRKAERQVRLEEKLKELENFPSYQNTHLSSPEDILLSWCGGLGEIPRLNSPFSVSNHYPLPNPNPTYSPHLRSSPSPSKRAKLPGDQNQSEGRVVQDQEREEIQSLSEDEEQVRTILQLYDFPACSNMNQASPASILASWCRLQVEQENHSPADSKKRRLDFNGSEFLEP